MHWFGRLLFAVAVIGIWDVNLFGRDNRVHLAATPPMGWNSWDSYGTTVRQDQVKANSDADVVDQENSCKWNSDMWGVDMTKPEAQAYYDSIAELYASWGVDFIKLFDCCARPLFKPAAIPCCAFLCLCGIGALLRSS